MENKTNYSIKNSRGGFSLIEMLFYVALLSLALVGLFETLIAITRSYGSLKNTMTIEREASTLLERILRESRNANEIDTSSILSVNPGKLILSTTSATGTPRTVEFSMNDGKLVYKENGNLIGNLTSGRTLVTNLIFKGIATGRSSGVKVDMTIESGSGQTKKTENFYATAVLRDSY